MLSSYISFLGGHYTGAKNIPFADSLLDKHTNIYTTKIDTFVCPPNISETGAVRIMKLAHRSRIASTTKKIISKQLLLSILSILF